MAREQYFDGDIAAELGVFRSVDLPHTTFADGGADLIRVETSSGGERHRETLTVQAGSDNLQ